MTELKPIQLFARPVDGIVAHNVHRGMPLHPYSPKDGFVALIVHKHENPSRENDEVDFSNWLKYFKGRVWMLMLAKGPLTKEWINPTPYAEMNEANIKNDLFRLVEAACFELFIKPSKKNVRFVIPYQTYHPLYQQMEKKYGKPFFIPYPSPVDSPPKHLHTGFEFNGIPIMHDFPDAHPY